MSARDEIAAVWEATTGHRPAVLTDGCLVTCRSPDWVHGRCGGYETLTVAKLDGVVGAQAYGVDHSEALAALLSLVRLHARMRRDEIDAALAAGGV